MQGSVSSQHGVMMTSQQLDQLLKLIPKGGARDMKETDTDEEIDYGLSGMVKKRQGQTDEN